MKTIIVLLLALVFLGQYAVGEMMNEPLLRYEGMGREGDPIAFYDPATDSQIYVPLSGADGRRSSGRTFIFEFNGSIYEVKPIEYGKIEVYRR